MQGLKKTKKNMHKRGFCTLFYSFQKALVLTNTWPINTFQLNGIYLTPTSLLSDAGPWLFVSTIL